MRHNVFLAFKEALNNVAKHSDATEALVFLGTNEDGFTLVLHDNGKGFDPAVVTPRPGRGNGLKNMAQRLDKIGGRCEVSSAPGGGTEIKFSVTVAAAAQKTN
jgi:signal transduction histidine kinase